MNDYNSPGLISRSSRQEEAFQNHSRKVRKINPPNTFAEISRVKSSMSCKRNMTGRESLDGNGADTVGCRLRQKQPQQPTV